MRSKHVRIPLCNVIIPAAVRGKKHIMKGYLYLVVLFFMLSCSKKDTMVPKGSFHFNDDFFTGNGGWVAAFADYPAGQEIFYSTAIFTLA